MVDLLRRRGREILPGDDCFTGKGFLARQCTGDSDVAAGLIGAERKRRLLQALDTLPASEKEVITMRFYGDLRFRDIALALQRPLGTVLWQVRRGLRRLREGLGDEVL